MTYHFIHYFEPGIHYLSEEDMIKIARERAIEDLAKELMKHAHFEVDECGNVRGKLQIKDSYEHEML